MSAADVSLRYRRIRAPREDGAALIEPPVSQAAQLVIANRELAETWDQSSGLPLSRWRSNARQTLCGGEHAGPLIFSGHQPSLFHPGVWLKNFLLDRIARQVGGTGVNLIVDNDTVRQAAIRVPTGSTMSPHLIEVPLDAPAPEMPWEERVILDRGTLGAFAARVHTALAPLHPSGLAKGKLLLDSLWPQVLRFADDGLGLGACLALARHAVERSQELATTEVPLSQLFGSQRLADEFLAHLLSRWDELHPIYNAALAEYRTINHIRSRNHPAPDLAAEGSWLEAPLWLWDSANPQRRKAFVRRVGAGFELTDRGKVLIRGTDANSEVKLRPRALITTMFARLILSDLFIHGIGGAKYDELTDALIRRFFGIEPPAYVTATATFRLPIDRPQATDDEVRSLERRIRDTHFAPESFVGELTGNRGIELNQHAAEKKELIGARWPDKQKKAWHDRVSAYNDRMSALLVDVRQQLLQRREKLLADLHAANLLSSREFSFVLFPEETLPAALLDLCAAKP